MDSRVTPLVDILRLNTRLFRNCLDGLTDEQASLRPSAATNSAAFVAAHLADARFYLLKVLGVEHPSPLADYLAGARSIDDVKQCPTLAQTHYAWTTAGRLLRDRLEQMTAADLDAPVTTQFPMPDATVLGALTFLVQHESYHIGQLALFRKYAGLPAMSYD
ncbi:MAG: DUF664 domain-containing protein [Gemmatimonadales bacterium]|nr:DUF664 domain-containing protein [Gemmatimonadales bacterium]